MSLDVVTLTVPDALGSGVGDVEALHALVDGSRPAERFVLDMHRVGFIKPYGVVALLLAVRRLADLSGRRVVLANIGRQIHSYLERMDLFEVGEDWLAPVRGFDEGWDRNPQTPNLLELTTIEGPQDVVTAITRAERVFSRWLEIPNLNGLLRVLSELCANVHQHSGDPLGCVMIQKYEEGASGQAVVCVAVGDLGCGVRASLAAYHGVMGREPLDYLRAAMAGRTSRASGRGGLGLRTVEEAANGSEGRLWLRSETAAVVSQASSHEARGYRDLCHVPGAQVAVDLRSPPPPPCLVDDRALLRYHLNMTSHKPSEHSQNLRETPIKGGAARYEMAEMSSKLGLPARYFLTREKGEEAYRLLEGRLRETPERCALVLVFPPGQLVDASFADESLMRLGEELVAGEFGERVALLEGLTEDSVHNLEAVIRLRRAKLVFLLINPGGGWHHVGPLEPSLKEALELAAKRREITAPELADELELALNTANNRLKRLHALRLLWREHEVSEKGLRYIYHLWQWKGGGEKRDGEGEG